MNFTALLKLIWEPLAGLISQYFKKHMPSPTNNNGAIDLRKRLAKEYCRSVLWLDDEIKPDAASLQREKFLNFFVRIGDEFSKQHILCQLKGFPQIKGGDDPYADNS